MQNSQRRYRYRSGSVPSFSLLEKEEHGRAAGTTRARELEMTIYQEERRRKVLQSLRDEYSDFLTNISRRALHFQSVRQNNTLRGIFDTARDFDQELLYLKFQLEGPKKLHFLQEEHTRNAARCISRAMAILISARWQIWRYVELWAIYAACEPSGQLTWSATRRKYISSGKLAAELECQKFWEEAHPWLERLLGELRKEVPRMRRIVSQLEDSRKPLFVRELKKVADPHCKTSKLSSLLPCLSSGSCLGSRQYEMSGGLSTDKARKTPTWINNARVHLERGVINNCTEVDLSAVPIRIRYRNLKARERLLRGDEHLETMRDAWVAFRDDLDNRTWPPSTSEILLRYKVATEVILSERRLQQLRERECSGSKGGEKALATQ
ncbi:hypothetical protein F5Y11DRAFT_367024 [Daldinia sp. FL1419]|nr:hypothetical protein F5Y11DRAFT_367024 [Daldinia sp. FL1419]